MKSRIPDIVNKAAAERWAVSGHGTPGEAFWSRALLAALEVLP